MLSMAVGCAELNKLRNAPLRYQGGFEDEGKRVRSAGAAKQLTLPLQQQSVARVAAFRVYPLRQLERTGSPLTDSDVCMCVCESPRKPLKVICKLLNRSVVVVRRYVFLPFRTDRFAAASKFRSPSAAGSRRLFGLSLEDRVRECCANKFVSHLQYVRSKRGVYNRFDL